MPNIEYVKIKLDLIKRVGLYIESVPSGPHPAGVPTSLLHELNEAALSSPKIIDAEDPQDEVAAEAAAEAETATTDAVKHARAKARKKRARDAKAAKNRTRAEGLRKGKKKKGRRK